ncbi:hypothetical protein ACSSV1_000593 [Labrenzia sp. MBR-25]
MRLTSPRFNWNARLQQAANNNPPMKKGDKGLYVRHVQQALIDLGHPLPKSTAIFGSPDGEFGNETKDKVIEFQRRQHRTDSKFDIDGIVGEQTMGAFDRLLRTPVTLPRIPTIGDSTDSNANLGRSIMAVLEHPRLADISFTVDGTKISRSSYTEVRDAIERGDITAEQHALPPNVRGFYLSKDALHRTTGAVLIDANTFVLPFSRAVTRSQMVTVVHEATHAFFDIKAFGSAPAGSSFSRDKSETIAHIAQATFHRILTGGPETDPLTPVPAQGLNPVFLKADELARRVLARDVFHTSTLHELFTLVRANRTAQSLPNTTDFDGV